MALNLVCDIIQGHGGNAMDRAERDPQNKAQHLAVMNTWDRLYHEVRALVDSPPFLRFQRALNHNYDLGVAIDGLSEYTPRINKQPNQRNQNRQPKQRVTCRDSPGDVPMEIG